MTTSVNAFSFGLPYKRHRRLQDSINVFDRAATVAGLVGANIQTIFETAKKKREKFK